MLPNVFVRKIKTTFRQTNVKLNDVAKVLGNNWYFIRFPVKSVVFQILCDSDGQMDTVNYINCFAA